VLHLRDPPVTGLIAGFASLACCGFVVVLLVAAGAFFFLRTRKPEPAAEHAPVPRPTPSILPPPFVAANASPPQPAPVPPPVAAPGTPPSAPRPAAPKPTREAPREGILHLEPSQTDEPTVRATRLAELRAAGVSVTGAEHMEGWEHVRVVKATGKILATSGDATLQEDEDGDLRWVYGPVQDASRAGWKDEWGALTPGDLATFADHFMDVTDCEGTDPPALPALVQRLGYRDVGQWRRAMWTAIKHFGTDDGSGELSAGQLGEEFLKECARARGRQHQRKVAATAAANPELLEPVDGITVEVYAQCAAAAATGLDAQQFAALLAKHGMDAVKWDAVNKTWVDRMSKDTTATIATIYGKAFGAAGQGTYGAAGAAAAAAQGPMGGMAGVEAGGAEPISFEKLCEVQGAMSAWSETGQDVNAMLKQVFGMVALDWSNVSSWWLTRMMTDWERMNRYQELSETYRKKYLEGAGGGGDADGDIEF
jgi:hypothetical protein